MTLSATIRLGWSLFGLVDRADAAFAQQTNDPAASDPCRGRTSGVDLKLDVIMTSPTEEPRPTLIHIHGGGWVRGSKDNSVLLTLPGRQRG
jgi:acetyl esterase/lipase